MTYSIQQQLPYVPAAFSTYGWCNLKGRNLFEKATVTRVATIQQNSASVRFDFCFRFDSYTPITASSLQNVKQKKKHFVSTTF